MFKVGDKVRIKKSEYTAAGFYDLDGEITVVHSENEVRVLILAKSTTPYLFMSHLDDRLELISSAAPALSPVKEKPCSNQYCRKMNDIGSVNCWWCAGLIK